MPATYQCVFTRYFTFPIFLPLILSLLLFPSSSSSSSPSSSRFSGHLKLMAVDVAIGGATMGNKDPCNAAKFPYSRQESFSLCNEMAALNMFTAGWLSTRSRFMTGSYSIIFLEKKEKKKKDVYKYKSPASLWLCGRTSSFPIDYIL